MKRLLLTIISVVLLSGMMYAQQGKDTISYPDWRYYHPQLDTSDTLFIVPDHYSLYITNRKDAYKKPNRQVIRSIF